MDSSLASGLVVPVATQVLPYALSAISRLARSRAMTSSGTGYLALVPESEHTGSVVVNYVGTHNPAPSPATIRDLLISIKSAFGLTVTELSSILRVGRPTVYSWLNESAEPHAYNIRRVFALHRLATRIDPREPPALDVRVGESTLLELLSSEDLDTEHISTILSLAPSRQLTDSVKLNESLARFRGSNSRGRHQLDILTGRPLTDEE
jgi:hypothetical protein